MNCSRLTVDHASSSEYSNKRSLDSIIHTDESVNKVRDREGIGL